MIIAITGASGHLGRLVVPRLRAALPTTDIVALARSPEKAADLGVAVRAADYDKPDTLDAALAGADTLLLISSSDIGRRVEQHTNVIAAAKDQCRDPNLAQGVLLVWAVAQCVGLIDKHLRAKRQRHIHAQVQNCSAVRAICQVVRLHLIAHDRL